MTSLLLPTLEFESANPPLKIHGSFRYPAKFHPPVARALIARYTEPGETVLDPFCGSGTLLVEATVLGRSAIGSDIDPLATFISRAKVARYDIRGLKALWSRAKLALRRMQDSRAPSLDLTFADLTEDEFLVAAEGLELPAIPNLDHWFRRYVQVELARCLKLLRENAENRNQQLFVELVFASVLRRASNADPVPVSGLEVTSHMRRLELAGRRVDPVELIVAKGDKTLEAIAEFQAARQAGSSAKVALHDARDRFSVGLVDAVITSPPYQNAVDYYRRHQLEMFWLGLTRTQAARLDLLPKYVGRSKTPSSDPYASMSIESSAAASDWLEDIKLVSTQRARDFSAYFGSMKSVFASIAATTREGANVVLVVGRSRWGDVEIPTEALFKQLVPNTLELSEHRTYPLKNRHMSYSRHNGANIDTEHVLAFKKTIDQSPVGAL